MPPRQKKEEPETTQLDTSKLVQPNEDSSKETTPIGDEAAKAVGYLQDADEADVTHFEEDDDPQQHAGDFLQDED